MTSPITGGNKQPKSPAISTNLAKINLAGQQKAPINSERNINQNPNYQQPQQYQGYEQQGLKRNNSINANEPKGMYDSRMDI